VHLRIEGVNKTIFAGHIATRGHNITLPHFNTTNRCDGTNNNTHPTPGATATSALDDAAWYHGFSWNATWNDGLKDFYIRSIDNDYANDEIYLMYLVNYQFALLGGCQKRVVTGDDVLFGFDECRRNTWLRLQTNTTTVPVGGPVEVTVTNGITGLPIAGAMVSGKITNGAGRATLTFSDPGVQAFKATKDCTIRSDKVVVTVLAGATPTPAPASEAPLSSLAVAQGEFATINSGSLGMGGIGALLDVQKIA